MYDGIIGGSDPCCEHDDFGTLSDYGDIIQQYEEAVASDRAWSAQQAEDNRQFQKDMQDLTMKYNSAEAQKNRDWQTEMSNTSYQRAVADLKAAGLNPVLAAKGLSGASTGSGSSASASAPSGSMASNGSSMAQIFTGIIQSLIGANTSITTTAMNNATSEKTTKMNNDTSVKTTQMDNDTSEKTTKMKIDSERTLEALEFMHNKIIQADRDDASLDQIRNSAEYQEKLTTLKAYIDEYMTRVYPNSVWNASGSAALAIAEISGTDTSKGLDAWLDKMVNNNYAEREEGIQWNLDKIERYLQESGLSSTSRRRAYEYAVRTYINYKNNDDATHNIIEYFKENYNFTISLGVG